MISLQGDQKVDGFCKEEQLKMIPVGIKAQSELVAACVPSHTLPFSSFFFLQGFAYLEFQVGSEICRTLDWRPPL